jgi:hypothetical protein
MSIAIEARSRVAEPSSIDGGDGVDVPPLLERFVEERGRSTRFR